MTKKDIVKMLKIIKKYCKSMDACQDCVFDSWCFGSPSAISEKEINYMANKIKEVSE